MKIGLIGTNGAGKSTVCDLLKKESFHVISLSDIVRLEAKAQSGNLDRLTLIQTANHLKQKLGADVLARRAYETYLQDDKKRVVFDSIRNLEEVLYLKEKDVFMVGLDASLEVRYARIKERQRETDEIDFETFKQHCEIEYSGKSSGQNLKQSLESCDVMLSNDSGLDELERQLYKIINQLKN